MDRLTLYRHAAAQVAHHRPLLTDTPDTPRHRHVAMMERRCSILYPNVPEWAWYVERRGLLEVVRVRRVRNRRSATAL